MNEVPVAYHRFLVFLLCPTDIGHAGLPSFFKREKVKKENCVHKLIQVLNFNTRFGDVFNFASLDYLACRKKEKHVFSSSSCEFIL
jgi:hypothetical protein